MIRPGLIALLACVAAPVVAQGLPVVTFTNVTSTAGEGRGILSAGGGVVGVAWFDWDSDSFMDFYVSGAVDPLLFHNSGNGTFRRVEEAPVFPPVEEFGNRGVAAVDYDNDGDVDLYAINNSTGGQLQLNWLFRNEGDGTFSEVAGELGVASPEEAGVNAAWLDVNRDGLLDFFMPTRSVDSDDSNLSHLFIGQPSAPFIDLIPAMGDLGADTRDFGPPLAFDYDNDGDIDLLTSNSQTQLPAGLILHENQSDQSFTEMTAAAQLSQPAPVNGTGAGDYDNDGDLDIYAGLFETAENILYRNNGDGTFTDATDEAGVPGLKLDPTGGGPASRSFGIVWADFDNDGWLDLYVTEENGSLASTGFAAFYHNQRDGTFVERGQETMTTTTGPTYVGTAVDYNRDGFLDLYLAGDGNDLFRNDGNANHWLAIDLVGTTSNRSAIGARVWVTVGSLTQMREVMAPTTFGSQSPLTCHFGLGSAEAVEAIQVRWPSGLVEDLSPPSRVDQYVTIVEGEGQVREDPNVTRAGLLTH